MRSNSIAGIDSAHMVPSHSAGIPHGSMKSVMQGVQISVSRSTQPDRRSPNLKERPIDGDAPSHASHTPLKTATNDTRKATISNTSVINSPTTNDADGSSPELANGSSLAPNWKAVESIDAIRRMKSTHTGVDTTSREPSSGFQLRVTTLTPASRISPTESGRSAEDATAAKLAGYERTRRSRRPWPAG